MAVRGLDLFSECFADWRDAFILIGGAACDLWFTDQNMAFRATKDLDVVLIADRLTPEFIARFWQFINDGEYEVKNRNRDGPPILFRFEKPGQQDFPYMLELFCREADGFIPEPDQHIVPVRMEDTKSLSAILLNESYYRFLLDHCHISRGIQAADGITLIPMKARAWLDLAARKAEGATVKEDDIKKHRNDVFRLAATLPGAPGDPLPEKLAADMNAFLEQFQPTNPDWDAIQQAIRPTVGGRIAPETLISAIQTYYRLARCPAVLPPHGESGRLGRPMWVPQ